MSMMSCRMQTVRWKPAEARFQTGVPAAPTFRPTPEQFKDPVAYINSIRPEAEKCASFQHQAHVAFKLPRLPLSGVDWQS